MKHAKVLDCTLRDGAYLVDKYFGDNNIRGIIKGLINSQIDIVEFGFLQDNGSGEGKTVYTNSEDAARFIPADKGNTMFTVLADYSRYNIDNLDRNKGDSFDAVRACFFKDERYEVIEFCKKIKDLGYKVFVQPVDIMGYTDYEIIEFINTINTIEPYCLSIVDTFGSMYIDDLYRIFSLVDHNLAKSCKVGFHSHNNLQMSNALSQEFLKMSYGKREVIVDTTLCGMGRGAGNTPTELVLQYMNTKLGYSYEIDVLLDLIDAYMDGIKSKCSWGYSTPYFVAGCYGAHINNVNYLSSKNSVTSKDIRYILNEIGADARKRYDYNLLEETYLEYTKSDIDDTDTIKLLSSTLEDRNVLLIAPGRSSLEEMGRIKDYCSNNNPIVISINFVPTYIKVNYIYFTNIRRYTAFSEDSNFNQIKKIVTSNISRSNTEMEVSVSFNRLIKCGWEHMNNSMILLLRLMDIVKPKCIAIAGFDGYSMNKKNYANSNLELHNIGDQADELNDEIISMLNDYFCTRVNQIKIEFVTESRFKKVCENYGKAIGYGC